MIFETEMISKSAVCFLCFLVASLSFASAKSIGNSTDQGCPRGKYCPVKGFPLTCPEGFYCPKDSQLPIRCPKGKYCVEGSEKPSCEGTKCTAGTHRYLLHCEECRGGDSCPPGEDKVLPCKEGFYCPIATIYPIPYPPGFYCPAQSESPVCCPVNCDKCSSWTDCSRCAPGYDWDVKANQCVKPGHCSAGTFDDHGKCTDCMTHCEKCSASNDCSQCANSYEWDAKHKKCNCPAGKFDNKGQCSDCMTHCDICSASNDCSQCANGYQWDAKDKKCNCPAGKFDNKGQCSDCITHCDICSASNDCSQCANGYQWDAKHKKCNCPAGTFDKKGQCIDCMTNCNKCSSSTDCSKCADGFEWDGRDTKCVKSGQCPDGTFDNKSQCSDCMTHCKKCTSFTNCSQCDDGYVWDDKDKICVKAATTCLRGSYVLNGKCAVCPAGSYCPDMHHRYECPMHRFCEEGSVVPTMCSRATTDSQEAVKGSTKTGLKSQDECITCKEVAGGRSTSAYSSSDCYVAYIDGSDVNVVNPFDQDVYFRKVVFVVHMLNLHDKGENYQVLLSELNTKRVSGSAEISLKLRLSYPVSIFVVWGDFWTNLNDVGAFSAIFTNRKVLGATFVYDIPKTYTNLTEIVAAYNPTDNDFPMKYDFPLMTRVTGSSWSSFMACSPGTHLPKSWTNMKSVEMSGVCIGDFKNPAVEKTMFPKEWIHMEDITLLPTVLEFYNLTSHGCYPSTWTNLKSHKGIDMC